MASGMNKEEIPYYAKFTTHPRSRVFLIPLYPGIVYDYKMGMSFGRYQSYFGCLLICVLKW